MAGDRIVGLHARDSSGGHDGPGAGREGTLILKRVGPSARCACRPGKHPASGALGHSRAVTGVGSVQGGGVGAVRACAAPAAGCTAPGATSHGAPHAGAEKSAVRVDAQRSGAAVVGSPQALVDVGPAGRPLTPGARQAAHTVPGALIPRRGGHRESSLGGCAVCQRGHQAGKIFGGGRGGEGEEGGTRGGNARYLPPFNSPHPPSNLTWSRPSRWI